LYSTNDKNIDKIMMVCLDNGHDVSTQEWSGSSWGSVVEHETSSSYFLYEPFAYVYDDKKPDIPDINVIIGAHQTVSIIFNNPDICDETLTRIDVQPENQTATYGIINTTNNGTAIASTFAVKFTSTPQTGYVMKIMNGTNHNFTISESYTNFTFDVGVNVMRQGWLFLNCTTPSDPLRVSLKFISYR